ncbi:helix-turn-helix domain-containing protein [Altererythrobacter sp. Root672]|uniref:helix-turn-helix domain-containing protein n=1 Tax=Altererythrobacter sp. Root672 TaxID=1736584 RepID=UPI001F378A76|nr:helix-turn-helix domain-containing protein [Altererythrobacter sp. Root672]
MNSDLLSGASGAATYTGLDRRRIYRLVEDGHLPVVRKGRRMFFRKSELDCAFRASGQA